jgi:glycosyltransferase involved in cell wall biosynthesis
VNNTGTKQRLSALFLSWEVPPFVAGGSWTATFHLVRKLVGHGVEVSVATPWSAGSLSSRPFEIDIPIVGLGAPMETGASVLDATSLPNRYSPYSPYAPFTPYRQYAPSHPYSPYSAFTDGPYSPYGPNSSTLPSGQHEQRSGPSGSEICPRSVSDDLTALADRLVDLPQIGRFDYLHAVDWISCAVASSVAKRTGIPWIAHLHSIEIERNSARPSPWIESLERRALHEADLVVVPSAVTKANIVRRHGVRATRVLVLANPISTTNRIITSSRGTFGSDRVVFLGRLTRQKGPDLYAAIATDVTKRHPEVAFEVFGAGELADSLRASDSSVELRGPVSWERRYEAFSEASAVVVSSRNEPFGMVVLEAMASGVPVLYPHFAGVAEVVRAGVQIDPHDVTASADTLLPLLRDSRRWSAIVKEQDVALSDFAGRRDELELIDAVIGMTSC